MSARFHAALIGWVGTVAAKPRAVLVATLVLTALALAYTLDSLSIDTSTTEMISPEVPFRQHDVAFARAFPEFGDTIVAVIDGPTPEQAERAARALAQALRADQTHFSAVDFPGGEPFFTTHGLLYLNVDELAELADRLAAAQPLLAVLAEQPNLQGLAEFVGLAAEEMSGPDRPLPAELDRLLGAMSEVVEAQIAGRPGQLSWRGLMEQPGLESTSRRLVIAQPVLDHGSLAPAAADIRALRAHAQRLGIDAGHGFDFRLTGAAVLDQEELESVSSGATIAGIVTTVAVSVLLVWGLRSFRLILATLITLVIGLILTAGLATLMIGRLNLISVTFAVLFVGLGVDFGIHFGLRYREAVDGGSGTRRALKTAVESVGGALTLSALCAAFGFLAFAPTSYQGLAELGWISASGMGVAWLATLTLMPALLRLMPVRPRPGRPSHGPVFATRFSKALLAASLVAGLASCAALPFVQFDFNPLNLKDPTAESVATFRDLADSPVTSPYGIEVLAPDLDQAAALAERLRRLDGVGQVITLSSYVPDDQDEKLDIIDQLALYLGPVLAEPADAAPLTPEERRMAFADLQAGLALLTQEQPSGSGAARLQAALQEFESEFDAAPRALAELDQRLTGLLPDLLNQLDQALQARPVTLADLPASLHARWIADDGTARVLVQPAHGINSNAELETFANEVLAIAPRATGTPVILTAASGVVINAFFEASGLALVTITAVLALVLHGLRDILLVLAPLALAILLTAASSVLLDLEFNFANVIVLPLLLGLGVSGAIHVIMRRRMQSETGALFATSTPRAVVFSALTTIASFGSLAVSDHRGMESMGQLLTIAILWSLFCTLVFLPSLLAVLRPLPSPKEGG